MNCNRIISAALAIAMSSSGFAFAQGPGERDIRAQHRSAQRGDSYDRKDGARYGPMMGQQNRGRADHYDMRRQGRGPNPYRDFRRGDRLPPEYRHRQYVVDDWRGHRLSAPPRGHRWVQRGSDYFLVAAATGVILQILQTR